MKNTGGIILQQNDDNSITLVLTGSWKLGEIDQSAQKVYQQLKKISPLHKLHFDSCQLVEWNSGLLTYAKRIQIWCKNNKVIFESNGLPDGARKLLRLANAVPENKDAHRDSSKAPFFEIVGTDTLELFSSTGKMLTFIGEASIAFTRLICGKARFRRNDMLMVMESCGGEALPIVSLISFLVGLILAFVGSIQLQLFGAQIYVANLVGIAMVRLMAAIMTGIVMAGRTGGAFAAQLGTMQVNQEIDALKTMGISPMEFLVLPRMLALALMMPLLCLYANIMGILGGMVVGVGLLDIGFIEYYNQTIAAIRLWDLGIGVFSGIVFGVIVSLAGCMRGMECGRSASSVGGAATSAVVTAVVGIILSTALITIICNKIGI